MDLAMSKMRTMICAERGDHVGVTIHAAETRRIKEGDSG